MIKGIINVLRNWKRQYEVGELNAKWRNFNRHNQTKIGTICNLHSIKVGNFSYGTINCYDFHGGGYHLL